MKFLIILSVIMFTSFGFISCDEEAPILKFSVKNGNLTCMMAEFSGKIVAQLSENITDNFIINGTMGNGSHCGLENEVLDIDGFDGTLLRFNFERINASIMLSSVEFTLNNTVYQSNSSKNLYTVPAGNSFKCESGITVDLTSNSTESTLNLSLKSIRFNPFRKLEHDEYEAESICSGDVKSNKTVPMIIAFVLGGMVVIMLVGYIILRRREDKSVYQTV